MSGSYTLKEDVYLVLKKYFKGSIVRLNKIDLENLNNNIHNGKNIKPIKPEILKELKKILKARDKQDINWIFPEWSNDKDIVKQKLNKMFPKNKLKQADPKPVVDWGDADTVEDKPDKKQDKPDKKQDKPNKKQDKPDKKQDKPDKKQDKPIKKQDNIIYITEHIKWNDELIFYPNNNFNRKNKKSETGKWIINNNELTLNWTNWEPEIFHTENYGETFIDDKGSILTLQEFTVIPKWFNLPQKKISKEKIIIKTNDKPKEPTTVKEYKYVLSQRKAYVDFINNDFYDKLMENVDGSMFKNYQNFVKGYLSLESPFRGLLVYHGLGTGKTATSIITTESLSNMKINTLLPKSLKDNYINEIKDNRFTGDTYDINNNNWFFYNAKEIDSNESIIKFINDSNLDKKSISNIIKNTKSEVKSIYKDTYEEKIKEINIGIFIKIEDVYTKDKEILTFNGKLIPNKLLKSYDNVSKLTDIQLIQLDKQIHEFILKKYNFIHSNALPKITEKQLKELGINNDELANKILNKDAEKKPSDRKEIMNKLISKYLKNKKKNILSPFYNEVIVIDEVHNLISQITNGRGPSVVFYDWIVESVDTKIIFLSGTPIINSPSEIAYIFNMLKGKLHVYDFVIKMTGDLEEITNKLTEIFYDKISCIEQLYVKKYKGKIVVSFIKIKSNFSNILDEDNIVKTIKYNDYSFDEFIKQVYIGLHKFTDPKLISPSQKEFKQISKKDKDSIINGKETIFDEETGVIFNKNHKLFEIYDDNQTKIDLTNNEHFMEYFFDDQFNIPPRKQVLLRRMLMGLTSYYPIDRSAISYMPEIKEPHINIPSYKDHSITKQINLVPCYMSYEQYNQYEIAYNKEIESDLRKASKKNMYEDESFHYYSATRQTCNIVYNEPDLKGDEAYTLMRQNNNFSENLLLYSPKMYEIMKNINKFINNDKPNGKVLLYSVYKSEGGSGGFEQVLIDHGYEKYDYKSNNINKLIETNNKTKRYTFITGDEDEIDKEENKLAYNNIENINGEYIQVMIISQSGAEGISLTCVRQVHILEPYWNNVRMDQVFGRAIRRNSHIGPDSSNPWLPVDKQNVEQYLYLSLFPDGTNTTDIFNSIKSLNWPITNDIEYRDNFNEYLLNEHKSLYVLIQNILNIKLSSRPETTDEMLFNIMERKFNINEKLNNIIKESSVDCIKHTTDDPILNSKCVQFSEKLKNEISYFPGIDADELNKIDNIQLKSTYSYFIKPDTIVVSSKNFIYSYYKINPKYKDEDARYIKENGDLLCDFFIYQNIFFVYENSKFHLNNKITNKFSVIQSIYNVPPDDEIYDKQISKGEFPRLDKIKLDKYLIGYKIKYNINDKLFFMPLNEHDLNIYKLYDYKNYLDNNYNINYNDKFLIIHHNNKFYENIL
jgi:hypothetical protein